MHQVIMRPTADQVVDHINGDTLDNGKANLRCVSQSGNGLNRQKLNANNTSGATGVSYDRRRKRWAACIQINRKKYNLGRWETKAEAIAAREAAWALAMSRPPEAVTA